MKVSTKFLLTTAIAAATLPLTAADCLSDSNVTECAEDSECPEGQVCDLSGATSTESGICVPDDGGEGEGEGEDCLTADFDTPEGTGLTLDVDAPATFSAEGLDDGDICVTAGQQQLFVVDVIVTNGNFAADIGGNDFKISTSSLSPNPTTCSNSPSTLALDGIGTLLSCPVCLADGDDLLDIAVQVEDNDGLLSPAICAIPE